MVYLAVKSGYERFFLETIYWLVLIVMWFVLFILTLSYEVSQFKISKKLKDFTFTVISIVTLILVIGLSIKIDNDFSKPTLLKAVEDYETTRVSLDFKKDGTYIFDSYSYGANFYKYGTYKISGDTIIMDKDNIDRVIITKRLEIHKKIVERDTNVIVIYRPGMEKTAREHRQRQERHIVQIDKDGNINEKASKFNVLVDQRKVGY